MLIVYLVDEAIELGPLQRSGAKLTRKHETKTMNDAEAALSNSTRIRI
jgi:hypothetical protein